MDFGAIMEKTGEFYASMLDRAMAAEGMPSAEDMNALSMALGACSCFVDSVCKAYRLQERDKVEEAAQEAM